MSPLGALRHFWTIFHQRHTNVTQNLCVQHGEFNRFRDGWCVFRIWNCGIFENVQQSMCRLFRACITVGGRSLEQLL
ncbi:unnamed protein product [Timema podura]|uniref:Uncharacterized protein n=1 Tax=Timema podura TaxID=61482 RepID=A0ABN7NUS7_TIMPD|nr:unnamed protein product [Timema podura]